MSRGVDRAMEDSRAEKDTLRQLWADAVCGADGVSVEDARRRPPLYLTLAGARGYDVRLLIDMGLIRLAQNGRAVVLDDVWKVVAVESNSAAYASLRESLPYGMRIIREDLKSILKSSERASLPQGKHYDWCRAHVVNIDMSSSLQCEHDREKGGSIFPTIEMIWKLAFLHAKRPALDWVLCLTLAADIEWRASHCRDVQRFLAENFRVEERFARASRLFLGDDLFESLKGRSALDLAQLSDMDKQALLMVFVPKKIIAETHMMGWRIETTHNLGYGGQRGVHRMVSWLMRFKRDPRIKREPRTVYSDCLEEVMAATGSIATNGSLRSPPLES